MIECLVNGRIGVLLLFPDEDGLTRLLVVLDRGPLIFLSHHRLMVHGLILGTARRLTRRLRRQRISIAETARLNESAIVATVLGGTRPDFSATIRVLMVRVIMLMEARLAALAAHVRRERPLQYVGHLVLGFARGSIG